MARPREFDPDEVLSQVMDIFWKEGFEKTSFSMIEERTGVKKASLCAAFGDKRSLFLTALRHYHESGLQASKLLFDQPSPKEAIRQKLLAAADMATGVKAKRGCFHVNCIIELAPHDPEISSIVKDFSERLADEITTVIHRGQHAGEFKTDVEPSTLAKYVIALIYGLSVVGKSGMRAAEIERIVDVALASLER